MWHNGNNYRQPITSYGIILFTKTSEGIEFLLYRRRDNFEYIDFLRGMWGNEKQLRAMFLSMNNEERERIRYYTFDELWNDLWVDHTSKVYNEGFMKSKRKYETIKHLIPEILDTTNSQIRGTPWGFPKGKKDSYNENPIECALREFEEETNIQLTRQNILHFKPYTENFRGSNGKHYSTHYYLAEYNKPVQPNKCQTPQCIREETVSDEASDVKWFKIEDVYTKLNPRRQNIIEKVLEYLESLE